MDMWRRNSIFYEFEDLTLSPPWFDIIVEKGFCDEFRAWQKWQDEDLQMEIFFGVDADGRFNVFVRVRVVKELSATCHKTGIWC